MWTGSCGGLVDVAMRDVAASTLVDRGEVAGRFFESIGVPYVPVFTYRDLDIDPVGVGSNQPNLGE